jgi:hypothetical protein
MPNFTAKITAGHTIEIWEDPAVDGISPSRINPISSRLGGLPHRYVRVEQGDTLTAKARVGGVDGPMDAALSGDLFTAMFVEYPYPYPPPALTVFAAQSSVVECTPVHAGHYVLLFERTDGGGFLCHFDVEIT